MYLGEVWKMVKESVDRRKCIGCGLCVSMLPEVFEFKKGKASVKNPNGAPVEKIKEVASMCAVQAITVEED